MSFGFQVFSATGVPLVASQDRLTRLIGTYATGFAPGLYQVDVYIPGLLQSVNFAICDGGGVSDGGTFAWITDNYLHVYCGAGASQTINTAVFAI